jgi:hypothetical protein
MNEKMRVEGKETVSESTKERGRVTGHSSSHDGSGEFADWSVPIGMKMIGFEAGRTIELRRFEFCRIRIWIRMYVPFDFPEDRIDQAEERFVLEMLGRESESLVGNNVDIHIPDNDIEVLSLGKCRSVGIIYGLTLKSQRNEFESNVVDVIKERPVSDGADIRLEFEHLSEEMARKLDKHHARIKSE